jgi:hypothetical protein
LKGKKISKNSLNRQIKEGFLKLCKNQMKQYSEGKLCTYTTFIRIMMICFDYIVVLIVHKHFVVKEIFLDIQVGSNSGKYFL